MKILIAAYNCSPTGGSEHRVGWYWAAGMRQRGHEVHLITHSRNPAIAAITQAGITVHTSDDVLPRWVERSQIGSYAMYATWQRRGLPLAARLDEAHDFDLIHHVSWGSLFWGTPLWRVGKPTVLGPIGGAQVAASELRQYWTQGWSREVARTLTIRHAFRHLPRARSSMTHCRVVAANTETATMVELCGGDVAALLPDATVPDDLIGIPTPPAPERPPTILWVGRVRPLKALDLALAVYAAVRSDVPNARMAVAGDGPTLEASRRRADALGVSDGIDWLGWVDHSDMTELYRSSRLLLFSSLRESLGAQVIESMANGLPVVALDRGGVHDFVPDTAGSKVKVTTPTAVVDELAQGCRALLVDDEAWAVASTSALEAAARYAESRSLDAMETIYRRVTTTNEP